ncbi:MAG TPA: dihydrofolate reductase [Rhizomicrobium sp.]|nr:dihydrofolate reductase [Rhizomicrobium sp.]
MSAIALVVAIADNGVIGDHGKIPWRISDDMKLFKAITLGKPIVMGRKTWDSLPKKPLPGRTNIVVTRDRRFAAPGATIVHSFDDALAAARGADEIAIIGGADIYRAALPKASRIYLTEVHRDFAGDAHFVLDRTGWRETSREDRATPDGLAYSIVLLERA